MMWLWVVCLSASPTPSTALERLADDVRAQVLRGAHEPPVAIFIDGAAQALNRSLATLVAAKLATARLAPMVVEPGEQAESKALEQGARTLVRLRVSVEHQKLVAQGDAYSLWVNFWSGRARSRSSHAGLIAATAEVDAEALMFATAARPITATPSTLVLKTSVLATFTGAIAALTSGDVDGDGRAEVLAVINEELIVFAADGRPMTRYDLAASPPSAIRTREAFAALSVLGPGRIAAWSAKRARAELLGWSHGTLKPVGLADAVSLDGVEVKFEPGFNRFSSEVVWAGRTVPLGVTPQAMATRFGLTLFVMPDGTAAISRGGPPTAMFSSVGVGSTLADLDGDTAVEVVLTEHRIVGDDELRVLSLAAVEAVSARGAPITEANVLWQSPLKRGRALAATAVDLDGRTGDEVILATALGDGTGELVLLRRETP